eukprot:TRINITY_DN62368_c0_g1_i1.p1 TRINITY_DN62368_c0_g1~~TRINITY_DN62368_c0_g1_i1.p1  ORF type:complete len:809 (-),score=126.30 TRINITY_DN62368_c0_g1_i1:251-2677(-)
MQRYLTHFLHPGFHRDLQAFYSEKLASVLDEAELHSEAANLVLETIGVDAARLVDAEPHDEQVKFFVTVDPCSGLQINADNEEETLVVPLFFAAVACCNFDGRPPGDPLADTYRNTFKLNESFFGFEGVIVVTGGRSPYGGSQHGKAGDVWIIVVQGGTATFQDIIADFEAQGAIRADLSQAYDLSSLRTLGRGATASVMRAERRCNELNAMEDGEFAKTTYAAKVILSPSNLAPIQSEVAHLVVLQRHPNIVGFFGAFRVDDKSIFGSETEKHFGIGACETRGENEALSTSSIMCSRGAPPSWVFMLEFCTGGDVFEDLKRRGPYSVNLSVELIHGVYGGIDHIHLSGIVHRDIKPENILLVPSKGGKLRPVITDFGISAYIQDWERMSKRCGTPGYTAPELLAGEVYGTKVDIFSAGAVFYRMLSNNSPFSGADLITVLRRTRRCILRFPAERFGHIPEKVQQCLTNLMTKQPRNRPTAAQAQVDVLELTSLPCEGEVERLSARRGTASCFSENGGKPSSTGSTALPGDRLNEWSQLAKDSYVKDTFARGGESFQFGHLQGERLTDCSVKSRDRLTASSRGFAEERHSLGERTSVQSSDADCFFKKSFVDDSIADDQMPRQPQPPSEPPPNRRTPRRSQKAARQQEEAEALSARSQHHQGRPNIMQPVPPQSPPSQNARGGRRYRTSSRSVHGNDFPMQQDSIASSTAQSQSSSWISRATASRSNRRSLTRGTNCTDEDASRNTEGDTFQANEKMVERSSVDSDHGHRPSFAGIWPFGGHERGSAFSSFGSALSAVRRPRKTNRQG